MKITRVSQMSRKEHTLEVPCTPEQLDAWTNGTHIQDAMPDVPAPLREFVMTGVTPEEWDEMFGEIDE